MSTLHSLHYYHWEFFAASICPDRHLINSFFHRTHTLQHLSCSFFSSTSCHNPNLELSPFPWFFQSTTIQAVVNRKFLVKVLGHWQGGHGPLKFPKIGYRTSHLPPLLSCVHLARSYPQYTLSLFLRLLLVSLVGEDGGDRACPHLFSS